MRFKRSDVSHLLRHAGSSPYTVYEQGHRLPSLVTAFKLGIVLRVPIEFLYPELYERLRIDLRAAEARADLPQQQELF